MEATREALARHPQERDEAEREDGDAAEVGRAAGGKEPTAAVEHGHVLLRPVELVVVLGHVSGEVGAP
jgi:hypothetical protein